VILFDLAGESENHPVYQALAVSNGTRQYDFLHSIVQAANDIGRPFLSAHVIKALNFHAITCLHTNAGEYRPCEVEVGSHTPPQHFRVAALMEDFVNLVNRNWRETDSVVLAAFVLWRLNYIHPFINGNGRTARAACYFVLCLHVGHLLPGKTILPELIKRDRAVYVEALKAADESFAAGSLDLSVLHDLLSRLIQEQMDSEEPPPLEPAAADMLITTDG
jgi:prophage maintenance system killer protein